MPVRKKVLIVFSLLLIAAIAAVLTVSRLSSPSEPASEALPLPERLAFMTGHVEAGLALYRAGEPKMAAKHLLHPVSEMHAAERVGLAAHGFRPDIFIAVSEALDQGRPAAEVELQLRLAESNLFMMASNAGGERYDLILFLLDYTIRDYGAGVQGGAIVDIAEYQDAYGFVRAALLQADFINKSRSAELNAALRDLLAQWGGAPLQTSNPTALTVIVEKIDAIRGIIGESHDSNVEAST